MVLSLKEISDQIIEPVWSWFSCWGGLCVSSSAPSRGAGVAVGEGKIHPLLKASLLQADPAADEY
jgi:hypothetical protein